MNFSSSIAFNSKMPSFSAFTHVHNKKQPKQGRQDSHSAEAWQTTCFIVPVEANLNSKVFPPLRHHLFQKTKENLESRLIRTYVVVSYFDRFD